MHARSKGFDSRKDFLQYAYDSSSLVPKDKLIVEFCRNKDVLDLGCIDHSYETAMSLGHRWLHRQLKHVAKSLLGVDVLSDAIKELNDEGFDIIEADAQCFNLRKTFDVIVAADLIEHLSNVGLFLDCVWKHMHEDSICIITTPNPFNIEQAMLAIFENRIAVHHQHTGWLDPNTIQEVISRSGLRIMSFYWIDTRFKMPVRRRSCNYLANGLSRLLLKLRPICRRDYAVVLKRAISRQR